MNPATFHDIGSLVKSTRGINPVDSAATTINGPAIDRQGYHSCVLHAACGAASGSPTAQTVDAKLQESADGSSGWADISGASITQITADNSEGEKDADLAGAKQYIRSVVTVAFTGGTSPKIPVAATVVLGGKDRTPAD